MYGGWRTGKEVGVHVYGGIEVWLTDYDIVGILVGLLSFMSTSVENNVKSRALKCYLWSKIRV